MEVLTQIQPYIQALAASNKSCPRLCCKVTFLCKARLRLRLEKSELPPQLPRYFDPSENCMYAVHCCTNNEPRGKATVCTSFVMFHWNRLCAEFIQRGTIHRVRTYFHSYQAGCYLAANLTNWASEIWKTQNKTITSNTDFSWKRNNRSENNLFHCRSLGMRLRCQIQTRPATLNEAFPKYHPKSGHGSINQIACCLPWLWQWEISAMVRWTCVKVALQMCFWYCTPPSVHSLASKDKMDVAPNSILQEFPSA